MSSEFIEFLHEVFDGFGAIQAKSMFGGHGIYHNGLMFALVADNVLYLKADTGSAGQFDERGLQRFEYVKQGKPIHLSYYEAPQEMFDDPQIARLWAERAYQAAVRSSAGSR